LLAILDVLTIKKGRTQDFGERLKALLQDALQLGRAFHAGEEPDFGTKAHHLLLRWANRTIGLGVSTVCRS
jgi:hypothetical protein